MIKPRLDRWLGQVFTHTGAVYLSCEAVVIEGEFARRKGLVTTSASTAPKTGLGKQGAPLVRAMLNSAKGFCQGTISPRAMEAGVSRL
jgi:hypothetical protein